MNAVVWLVKDKSEETIAVSHALNVLPDRLICARRRAPGTVTKMPHGNSIYYGVWPTLDVGSGTLPQHGQL